MINRNFPNYSKPSKELRYLHISAPLTRVPINPANLDMGFRTVVQKGTTYRK